MKANSKKGFTLIEMLVVCLIIVILAGLVFRLTGIIGRNNDEAKTRAKLEMVASALEEFKSIYGKYPPVRLYSTSTGPRNMFRYEYPGASTYGANKDKARENARRILREGKGKLAHWNGDDYDSGGKDQSVIFTFGLCSFFVPRVNGTAEWGPKELLDNALEQWSAFNTGNTGGDSTRDIDAVRRILPHLGARLGTDDRIVWDEPELNHAGILEKPWGKNGSGGGTSRRSQLTGEAEGQTNRTITITDAWSHDLNYYSIPPYETYKLWSAGVDGMTVGSKCRNASHGHDPATKGTDWAGVYWVVKDGDPETIDDLVVGEF